MVSVYFEGVLLHFAFSSTPSSFPFSQDWAVGDLFFTPTIESETENAFLPKELDKLESEIPFVTGITSGEGGLFASGK